MGKNPQFYDTQNSGLHYLFSVLCLVELAQDAAHAYTNSPCFRFHPINW